MGTDIHLFVEKRNKKNGNWEIVRGKNPNIDWYRTHGKWWEEKGDFKKAQEMLKKAADIESGEYIKKYAEDDFEREYYAPEVMEGWLYDGRNYDLFAILADVRNGTGFAGCKTGEGFNIISEPRGLPNDMSTELEDYSNEYYEHSGSHLLLKEVLEFDWGQVTKKHGVVNQKQYEAFLKDGVPDSWCGGVSGSNVEHITTQEMDDIIAGFKEPDKDKSYYTAVSWDVTYTETVGQNWFNNLKKAKEISESPDYDDVRLVFWFDS